MIMDILLSSQAWLSAGLIFILRVSDMTLDTLRVLFVMRGKKKIAWVLGFFQSAIFVLAIGKVLTQMNNPFNILGYAAGFRHWECGRNDHRRTDCDRAHHG